jgi:hypothetical protein
MVGGRGVQCCSARFQFLVNKNLDENITLKELYEKTKKKLIIGTTNLTQDNFELGEPTCKSTTINFGET